MPVSDSTEWVGLPALDISRMHVLFDRWNYWAQSYFDWAAAVGLDVGEPLLGRTTIGTANLLFASAHPESTEEWPASGPLPEDFAVHRASVGLYPDNGLVPIGSPSAGDPSAQSEVADLDWTLSFIYACALTRMLYDLFNIRPRGRPKDI